MSNSWYDLSQPSGGPPPVTTSDPQSFAYVLPVYPNPQLPLTLSSNQAALPYHDPKYQFGTQADPPPFPEDLGDVAETTTANPSKYQSPSLRNIERPTNSQRWSPYPASSASRNANSRSNASIPRTAYSSSHLNVPPRSKSRKFQGARQATKSLSPLSQPVQFSPSQTAPGMGSGQQLEHIMSSHAGESSELLGNSAVLDSTMLQPNPSADQIDHTLTITFRDPFSPQSATGTPQEEASDNHRPALSSQTSPLANRQSPVMSQVNAAGPGPTAHPDDKVVRRIAAVADRYFRASMKGYFEQVKTKGLPTPPPPQVIAAFRERALNVARHRWAQYLAAQHQSQRRSADHKQAQLQPGPKLASAEILSMSPVPGAASHQDGEGFPTMLSSQSSQAISFESLLEHDQNGNDQNDYNDQSNRLKEFPIQIKEDPSVSGLLLDNTALSASPASRSLSNAEPRLRKLKAGVSSSVTRVNHAYDQRASDPDRFQFHYAESQLGVEQAMFNYMAAYTAFDQLYTRMWTTTDDELLEVIEYVSRRLKSNLAQLDTGVRRRLDGIVDPDFKWTAVSRTLAMFYNSFSSLKAGLMQRDKKRGDRQKTFVEALGVDRSEVWDAIKPSSDEELDGAFTEEMAVGQEAVQQALLRPREFEAVTAELLQDSVRALERQ